MIRISQIIVVEGKYDATKLANIVDGLIITTDGFAIFSDKEKRELIKTLGKKRGIIVLTDSDKAGFSIRNYINNFATGIDVKNLYIPNIQGKEKRKEKSGKEGLLGVEGMSSEMLSNLFQNYGIDSVKEKKGREITYSDLFILGFSGTQNSSEKRREFLSKIGLPLRMSKKILIETLNSLYSYEELCETMKEKPVLFWDYHGTLVKPDIIWYDSAEYAIEKYCPENPVKREIIEKEFNKQCLPWWYFEDRDTRHLVENDGWWQFSNGQFVKMFERCGYKTQDAEKLTPYIREFILKTSTHKLYDDTYMVLDTLKKRGYKSYILSNNFPELEEITKDLGIRNLFEGCVVSAKIGYAKPRKEIFEYALELANVNTGVMIGDSIEDDIIGANKMGFLTVAVNDGASKNSIADYKCKELTEILDIFK